MKKFIYCLLPLFALQIGSCAPTKAFSREALPKDPEDPTIVTGFKNRITFVDGILNDATSATYNSDNLPIVFDSLRPSKKEPIITTNAMLEYEYNKDCLMTSEKKTIYAVYGGFSDIKQQEERNIEYDNYKNPIKDTTTHKDYSGGEIVSENTAMSQTSYDYDENGNLLKYTFEHFENEERTTKESKNYSYDEKQRLINAEEKKWDEDFDNPDGYRTLLTESHTYEDRKIIDTSETLTKIEGEYVVTEKTTKICEYDSNYNLIHETFYAYDPDSPLKSTTTESFYEYNSKGLETCFRSYVTNGVETAISSFEYRITTYCETNSDKIESQISIKTQVHKLNDSNSDKSQYKNLRNYYDDKQRVIRQEISSEGKGKEAATQTTYLFEY